MGVTHDPKLLGGDFSRLLVFLLIRVVPGSKAQCRVSLDGVVAANAAVGVAVCLVRVPGGVGTCWPASLDAVGY